MRPVLVRRTRALVAVVVVALIPLAGCSGSKAKPAAAPSPSGPCLPQATPKPASTEFGQRARIDIPAGNPSGKLDVSVKTQGHGTKVADGDLVVLNFTGKLWRGGCDLGSSYDVSPDINAPKPVQVVEGRHQVLPGWETAMEGQQAGSRIEAIVPPADGFGAKGRPADQSFPVTITGTDTMIFMIDIVGVYPGGGANADIPAGAALAIPAGLPTVSGAVGAGDPKITIPAGKTAPTSLVAQTVIKGTGPVVQSGHTVVMQYEGILWRDGSLFDSSWSKAKAPFATAIGVGAVVKGWDQGLVGKTVGSRVLLVIPPALGYGSTGQPAAGIKGDDTMVFVVDILDAG